ncbi:MULTISPECIES: hypothetical protein [Caulobacter]|jgi:hypothetical protein|uniref:Uncharacterized protein n=1 Tax=Caulobacter vibrioides OR37 TaxID=1292034 RepID=R0E9G5_CAUVI|nr:MULTISPECIES: hypothetical protein [Caulobacter]ENZ82118.1 hypothetical protein OR37_01929 [Caulobacter vibrioides OR37]MBQ1559886.1 hypothetical protein [Caulobacter sp.]
MNDKPALWPTMRANSARLYVLIARKAGRAVVFRRGPTKRTLVLTWDLRTDTLVPGQWLKGRIYERRADLSPDGELLVYAAAKGGSELTSWVAVSRPPYLTALALWTEAGMWGGGLFGKDWRSLQLNLLSWEVADKDRSAGSVSSKLRVSRLHPYLDELRLSLMRLQREGWDITLGERKKLPRTARYGYVFDPPIVQTKALRAGWTLVVEMHAANESNGRLYVETASVRGADGVIKAQLGRVDWADIDLKGDIILAREGCLSRLKISQLANDAPSEPSLIADLNDLSFRPLETPAKALRWP